MRARVRFATAPRRGRDRAPRVWRASGARARRTARVARGVAAQSRSPAKKPRLAASAIRGTRGRVRPVWPRYSARSSRTWLTTVSVKRGARAGDGREAYQGIHRVRVLASLPSIKCAPTRIRRDRPIEPFACSGCASPRGPRGVRVSLPTEETFAVRGSARATFDRAVPCLRTRV